MKQTKKANVLIYSLVLVNLSLLLALAMFNNFFVFLANTEWSNIERRLSKSIINRWWLFSKFAKKTNSNGSGFIDVLWCPDNITMSWTTAWSNRSTWIATTLSYTWSVAYGVPAMLCIWNYNSEELRILFNSELTAFSGAEYAWEIILLSGSQGERNFTDSEETIISGVTSSGPDGIDDNFNSDDFSAGSSWSIDYPDGYIDDDALVKTQVYGYIAPDAGFTNIFWNNSKTSKYIEQNVNNTWSSIANIGTWTLRMYLNADKDMQLKILTLSKSSYDNNNELIVTDTLQTDIAASEWFIQDNAWTLSFSGEILSDSIVTTSNEFVFDYVNNDYAIFLNNTGSWILTYSLLGYNQLDQRTYINPIDDSNPNTIKYLWAEILQEINWNYIAKVFEIFNEK